MNKTVLVGRAVADPELKYTPGAGTAVATVKIAVNRRFKKDGEPDADFFPVVIWGKQAESAAKFITKGKLFGVSGRTQIRTYQAKDGTSRYITEVIADEIEFIEWPDKPNTEGFSDLTPVDDENLPF